MMGRAVRHKSKRPRNSEGKECSSLLCEGSISGHRAHLHSGAQVPELGKGLCRIQGQTVSKSVGFSSFFSFEAGSLGNRPALPCWAGDNEL